MKNSRKVLVTGIIFSLFLQWMGTTIQVSAGVEAPSDPQIEILQPDNPYIQSTIVTTRDGTSLEADTINGPPHPPPGYELERATVALVEPDQTLSTNILSVPAYDWVFGCSAVSAAMIAGYYDNNGYPNMYTGPTNSGVAPLDSSLWTSWVDGYGDWYPNNPLVASHQGLDGRAIRGSIDDYWLRYESGTPDPYITGGWSQHDWGDAVGDFMKTSQSDYDNIDGSTQFYNRTYSSTPLTCSDMVFHGISTLDGTYGRKLFYQTRGYTVTDCYNQLADNKIAGGFSFAQFKAEIDASHPVLLNLEGHSIVGVGYNDTGNTVYLHDTWDNQTYSMTWGGNYAGMPLRSVSIVHLGSPSPPGYYDKVSPTNEESMVPTNPTLSWETSSGVNSYEYCYDTTNDSSCSSWSNVGMNTSISLSGLSNNTSYFWQVRAINANGTTYANGSATAFWSFTTLPPPPGTFNKIAPTNGATEVVPTPILSWGESSDATGYDYCLDTTDDGVCNESWVSTGTNTSVSLSGLSNTTSYYWQVRATNPSGTTYANESTNAFWAFSTILAPPGAFDMTTPSDGAIGVATNPLLTWEASDGATGYEFCYDSTHDAACSSWIDAGTSTSVQLSGLGHQTTYYWKVRAVNAGGKVNANGDSSFWRFTTLAEPPAPFNKLAPAHGSTGVSSNPTLTWETSVGADHYEYCIDTSNDNACSNWTSTDTMNQVQLNELNSSASYYWQVRAVNSGGASFANGSATAFWSLTIMEEYMIYLPIAIR